MVVFTDRGCVPVIALVLTTSNMTQKEVSLHMHLHPHPFRGLAALLGSRMSMGDSRFRKAALYSLVLPAMGTPSLPAYPSNSTPFTPSSLKLCLHASGPFPHLMSNF